MKLRKTPFQQAQIGRSDPSNPRDPKDPRPGAAGVKRSTLSRCVKFSSSGLRFRAASGFDRVARVLQEALRRVYRVLSGSVGLGSKGLGFRGASRVWRRVWGDMGCLGRLRFGQGSAQWLGVEGFCVRMSGLRTVFPN